MTNDDVSHDEQVRVALGRYQERFEPAEAEWAAIEARHWSGQPAPPRRRSPWWKSS